MLGLGAHLVPAADLPNEDTMLRFFVFCYDFCYPALDPFV